MLPAYTGQLDPERRRVFLALKAFRKQFVLAGGTAIMLQIGHRKSLDFDCKAYTIGRRGAWRDYIDLFFFLKWELYSLEKIIELAEKKFAGEFNEKLFLGQLTYFDDLDILPTTFLKEGYTPGQIKSFLKNQVRKYLKEVRKI